MKMLRLLLPCLLAFLLVHTAGAEVAVWKGTGKQTVGDSSSGSAVAVTIYFVIDLSEFTGRIIVATPSTREVYDEGERSYGLNVLSTEPRKTVLFTDAIAPSQNGPLEFNHQMVNVRGKENRLFIGPGDTNPKDLPRKLAFLLSETAAGIFVQFGAVVEGRLTYEESRTQAANAVGKTIMTVSQEIRGELITNKGYTEVAAP